MKFEKRNFMGIELDVLVGHPEHDLLFVATQVARAAGLKNPHMSATKYRNLACNAGKKFLTIGSLVEAYTESRDFIGSMEGKRKALQDRNNQLSQKLKPLTVATHSEGLFLKDS